MDKITIPAVVCSALAALLIAIPAVMLAEFFESVEQGEIDSTQEVLSRLVLETIRLKNDYFEAVGNSVGGLYEASELVTEEEFVTFADIMMKNSPTIENILVFDDEVIHSHPLQDLKDLDPRHLQATMTHGGTRYLVLINRADSGVSTALFVNPKSLVPLDTFLKLPFKAVLYADGERIFGVESTSSGGVMERTTISSDELLKTIRIESSLEVSGKGGHSRIGLDYLVYQLNFEREYEWLYAVVVLGGIVLGCTVASLLFLEMKTRHQLGIRNRDLKTNSDLLKKMESLLLESEERYRNLFELSPNPVCTIDMDGRITSANSRAYDIFGYGKSEVLERHFTDFVSESDAQSSLDLFKTVLSTGRIQDVNIRCKKKDGTIFAVNIGANTLINKDAQAVGVIVIITPLK